MNQALRARRFDIVRLLVEHGFDPKTVDMKEVFESWDSKAMTYFIERGANIRKGNPFAAAFCSKIRTALRPFKEMLCTNPDLMEQANIALRYHCYERNVKWIALMLWIGADPHKIGTEKPEEVLEDEADGLSALEFAALNFHYEVFEMKPMLARMQKARVAEIFRYMTRGKGIPILQRLLGKGINPNDRKNGSWSAI